MAAKPPREWPATAARGILSASRKPPTNSPSIATVYPAGGRSEPPEPGKSGAITRYRPANSGNTHRQASAHSPPPWSSTSGGPVPAVR